MVAYQSVRKKLHSGALSDPLPVVKNVREAYSRDVATMDKAIQ